VVNECNRLFTSGICYRLSNAGGFKDITVTVEDENVVDVISVNEARSAVVLTVSDHLDWSDTEQHQTILQTKLNRYLAFVESGELLERYPAAKGLAVKVLVIFKFRPDRSGEAFLKRAGEVVKAAGVTLQTKVFAESYNN
jgi:hypothetical protein